MASDHRLTILLTEAQYVELQGRAGLVPLGTWIKSELFGERVKVVVGSVETRKDETGDHQDGSGVSDVPMDSRRAPASRGFTRTSAPKVDAEASPSTVALDRRASQNRSLLAAKNNKGKRPKLCQHNFYEGTCPKGC